MWNHFHFRVFGNGLDFKIQQYSCVLVYLLNFELYSSRNRVMQEQAQSKTPVAPLVPRELVSDASATGSECIEVREFSKNDIFNLPLSTRQYEIVEGILQPRALVSGKHKKR